MEGTACDSRGMGVGKADSNAPSTWLWWPDLCTWWPDPTYSGQIHERWRGYSERRWLLMDGLDGPIDGLGGTSRVFLFSFLFLLTEAGINPPQKMLH
jgi:hypothetical protein